MITAVSRVSFVLSIVILVSSCATAPSHPVPVTSLQQASPFLVVAKVARDPAIADLGLNFDSQPQTAAQGGAMGGGLLQLASELTAASQEKERIALLAGAWTSLKTADHGALVTSAFLSAGSPPEISIGQVRLDEPSQVKSADGPGLPGQAGLIRVETAMAFSKELEVLDISSTYRVYVQPTRGGQPDSKGEVHYLVSPGVLSLDKAANASHWQETLSGPNADATLRAAYGEIASLILWVTERGFDPVGDASLPSVNVMGIAGKDLRRTSSRIIVSPPDGSGRVYSVPIPAIALRTIKSVAVVRNPDDERNLDDVLVGQLQSRGFTVRKVATVEEARSDDAAITYESKWIWDLMTYLNKVTLRIIDPANGSVLGLGGSHVDSLGRKKPEVMVDLALRQALLEQR